MPDVYKRQGYSSSTVGKAYRLLKQVLSDAVNNGVIMRNPLATVKPPKRGNKKQGINALDTKARTALSVSYTHLSHFNLIGSHHRTRVDKIDLIFRGIHVHEHVLGVASHIG